LKCLRSDRGEEFTSNEFEIFYNVKGIKRQTLAPRTPPHNGIAGRRNRFVIDCARTLMMEKNVALKYWREVVSASIHTLSCVQVKKGTNTTPFELWYGHSPNVKNFKMFGCKCYILKDNRNRKIDAKSDEGIFLGYSTRSKAYKCLNPNTNKIVESENVNFDEHAKVHVEEPKRLEEYITFVYSYEGIPIEEDVINQFEMQHQVSVSAESHPGNVELHLEVEL
jgi:hypothetical protein